MASTQIATTKKQIPIKIALDRLIQLFGRSVNDEALPMPVRALAARLMTLTAHTLRIDQKTDASNEKIESLSAQLSELTDLVHVIVQQQAQAAPAPAAATAAPSENAPPTPQAAETDPEQNNEEDDEAAFFAKAQQEAEAEVAAINNAQPAEPVAAPAPVVSLARGKKAGGAK